MIGLLNTFITPQQIDDISPLVVMAINQNDLSLKQIFKNLSQLQAEDTYCKTIINSLNLKQTNNRFNNFEIHQQILFHREEKSDVYRIVLPEKIINNVMSRVRSILSHPGVYKL